MFFCVCVIFPKEVKLIRQKLNKNILLLKIYLKGLPITPSIHLITDGHRRKQRERWTVN